MPAWTAALSIAVLVATIPFAWVLRLLQGLPAPVAASHRRWPGPLNLALIGAVTANTTVFIHGAYYSGGRDAVSGGLALLIAAVVYVFGFVLLLRQFAGLYPEYFVSTGRSGLTLRKALYRHVAAVERIGESPGETRLRVRLQGGAVLPLNLPTRDAPTLYRLIEQSRKLE